MAILDKVTRDRDDDLVALKPPSEDLGMAMMRARLEAQLFGVARQPTTLGRLVVLKQLGQGNMGVVYQAYDPELNRRVAVKLLRTDRGTGDVGLGRERLLREAQALARLSHPNVVPIYDVGVLDDQVFLTLEFVVGRTLCEWLEDEPRSWRQIVEAYRQAGAGLAAAHGAGMVHRDFKPDNAIIGDDGRVRVLDFGLARGRAADTEAEPPGPDSAHVRLMNAQATLDDVYGPTAGADLAGPTAPLPGQAGRAQAPASVQELGSDRLNTPSTATRAILGTPAYMSPEQFSGVRVGPASDQFSLCAALFEALYGSRPFAGGTVAELAESVLEQRIAEPARGHRVPGWLYPALVRGLQVQPNERYPSMDALQHELGRDPSRTRRRWLLGLALTAAFVAGLVLVQGDRLADVAVCESASEQVATVWAVEHKAALRAALLAIDRPYATLIWERVEHCMDHYAEDWASTPTDACLAHREGRQSDELLDRRMACLDERRHALASAVDVLAETTADTLSDAPKVALGLPDLAYCSNLAALAAAVPPPEDPAVARRVDQVRARRLRLHALENAGRYSDALAHVEELASAADAVAHMPLMAEVQLTWGRLLWRTHQCQQAAAPLERASLLALTAGVDLVVVEALARRIYVEGLVSKASGDPLVYLPFAEALVPRVADASFVRALLLNNVGAVLLARGDRAGAREQFEKVLTVME